MFRNPGAGFACTAAGCRWSRCGTDRRHHRQPHAASHTRKWSTRRLRRAKRKRGSKLHLAVDTLGHLLALHVTPANVDDRAEVGRLAAAIQDATGENVTLAYVDQGYTGEAAAEAARRQCIELHVVKLPEAKRGFVLLPKRWVVERSFACATRCRRLVKDYERYATTLAGFHIVAFACLMLKQAAALVQSA